MKLADENRTVIVTITSQDICTHTDRSPMAIAIEREFNFTNACCEWDPGNPEDCVIVSDATTFSAILVHGDAGAWMNAWADQHIATPAEFYGALIIDFNKAPGVRHHDDNSIVEAINNAINKA